LHGFLGLMPLASKALMLSSPLQLLSCFESIFTIDARTFVGPPPLELRLPPPPLKPPEPLVVLVLAMLLVLLMLLKRLVAVATLVMLFVREPVELHDELLLTFMLFVTKLLAIDELGPVSFN
jgi:hypothetical protein